MKIQVLMSTYNGEKYLVEQMDSILFQELPDYVELSILVRDDGSSDTTRDLLRRYAETYPEISYFSGKNRGAIKSFFSLVRNADPEADFYAFSDQDDIWHPKKLKRALTLLRQLEKGNEIFGDYIEVSENMGDALLYCCRPRLVDHAGNPLPVGMKYGMKYPAFGNALVENIVYGCTMVMNRQLLEIVKNHIPRYTIMHDWWFYLTATSFGRVVYDSRQLIDYRQHGNNEMGSRSNYVDEFKERLSRFFKNRNNVSDQVREFLRLYGDALPDQKRQMAKKLLAGKKYPAVRRSLFFDKRIFRQRKEDDVIFRVIYLTGSY